MAVISPDTFDPLRRYVGVRLQQGVPIVDADENEREDVRKFELRAFLKWFVGDGVPEGNDGFRLDGTGLANDFVIRVGVGAAAAGLDNLQIGLRHVGRCLVDGMDAIITADQNFSAQPLHANQPGSAALATAWGVAQITMPAPANQTLLAYLDVWERLVSPTEEPDLLLAGLGSESCARLRREWAVRVRVGTTPPVPGNGDFVTGHSYYPLALITRRASSGAILAGDIADLREKRLLTPPATLISDVLGLSPSDYRRGQGRPIFNLRAAINALLRGELPSTPETALATDPTQDFMSHAFLLIGDMTYAVWHSRRVGGINQVFLARWLAADTTAAGAATATAVTSGATPHALPHAVPSTAQELFVVYETAQADIHFRRVNLTTMAIGAEEVAAATAAVNERHPYAVVAGTTVVVFWHVGHGTATPRWFYRRWRTTDNTWLDGAGVQLSAINAAPAATIVGGFHAVVDGSGNVWAAFTAADNTIRGVRFQLASQVIEEFQVSTGGATNDEPFLLAEGNAAVWIFWTSGAVAGQGAIQYQRIALPPAGAPATWTANPAPVAVAGPNDFRPAAVRLADGAIWLFWRRVASAQISAIWSQRFDPFTGTWGSARQISSATAANDQPSALAGPGNAIQLFWQSSRNNNLDLYTRMLATAI